MVNNNENYEKAIELLEYEVRTIRKSKEFLLGSKIYRWKQRLLHFNVKQIITIARRHFQLRKRYLYFDIEPPKVEVDCKGIPVINFQNSDRITIYTCITNGYDSPKRPLLAYSNCDYILYTDDLTMTAQGWQVRPIPEKLTSLKPADINRYLKFHPTEFFNTRFTIYIDGNIKLLAGISKFIDRISPKTGLAIYRHPWRDCIRTEVRICQILGKGDAKNLQQQVDAYLKEGFPLHFGLLEASVIVSDLHNPRSTELLTQWYQEHAVRGGGRDQISLPYILWKNHLTVSDIGILGEDIDQSLLVRREGH